MAKCEYAANMLVLGEIYDEKKYRSFTVQVTIMSDSDVGHDNIQSIFNIGCKLLVIAILLLIECS